MVYSGHSTDAQQRSGTYVFQAKKQLLQRTGKGHVQRSQVATSSKVQGEHLATRPKLKCPGSTGTETTGHVKG